MSNTVSALRLVKIGVRVPVHPSKDRARSGVAALQAEKRQMRYLIQKSVLERRRREHVVVVRTGHLYFALGIGLVSLGVYYVM